MSLASLVAGSEGRASAILARLPTYFKPKTVLVIAEDESPQFIFTVSFMFMDATIYVLSSEEIPLDQFEHEPGYERVAATKELENIDLMIVSAKKLDEVVAKRLSVVAKKHEVQKILIVSESEHLINEKFYQYTISGGNELVQKYYPLSEKVFLLEK
jgi:hypothetical protein